MPENNQGTGRSTGPSSSTPGEHDPVAVPLPPDDLLYNEPPDSAFVTEEVQAMKRWTYILLILWLIASNLLAFWGLIWAVPLLQSAVSTGAPSVNPSPMPMSTTATVLSGTATASPGVSTSVQSTVDSVAGSSCVISGTLQAVLCIAFVAGWLGGALHGLASIIDYRGERRLLASWTLWYVAQPIQGAISAVIFIVIVQAGLLTGVSGSSSLNSVGVIAIALLVGMCADDATTRLGIVFSTFFNTPPRSGSLRPNDDERINLAKLEKQRANLRAEQNKHQQEAAQSRTAEERNSHQIKADTLAQKEHAIEESIANLQESGKRGDGNGSVSEKPQQDDNDGQTP